MVKRANHIHPLTLTGDWSSSSNRSGHFLLVPYVNSSYSCQLSFFVATLIAEVKFCKYQRSSKIHIQLFGEEKKENDNRSNAVTDCFAALSVTVCFPSIKLQTGCAGISN